MSALIIYKTKNELYMASDTATSIIQNGLHYRVNDTAKKLYVVDNQLIWCTGVLNIAYRIMEEYEKSCNHSIENLSLIAKKYSGKLTNVGSNRILIYVAECASGKIGLYNILSNDNFKISNMPLSNDPEEVTLYTAGAENEEAFKFACKKAIENSSPEYIFKHTMDHISCKEPEMIGGYCEAYELSSVGIKKIMDYKIKENSNTRYFQIMGSSPDSRYEGGFLKLYNGSTTKERVEIGTYSANDMGVINIKNNSSSPIIQISGNTNGGAISLNNNVSSPIVVINGNSNGGIVDLNDAYSKLKVHISSMDDTGANQGIIQLNGDDNNPKLILKAKSDSDNMALSGRQTGGFIQFQSYGGMDKYFITVNQENNFGMYDINKSAFEINKKAGVIINHQNRSNINLFDGGVSILVEDRSKFRVAEGKIDKDTGTITGIDYGIGCIICTSSASFAGINGMTIQFGKSIGNTNYTVVITPNANPNGYVGEIWVTKYSDGFTVYNSGTAVTGFDYMAIAY